ncbi:MAG TPA: hypothetical protein VES39_00300 [Rhodospirillales bacterium]|nr:hypothetical protein [Rhodospirillales bacterium]
MQALIVVESQAQPWSFRIEGNPENYTFPDADAALRMARKLQQLGHRLRIGYTGIQADMPGAVAPATPAMFLPCINIHIASRALAALEQRCRREEAGKRDPTGCALSLYRVGSGAPDRTFADEILLQASLAPQQLPAVEFVPLPIGPGAAVSSAPPGDAASIEDPEVREYLDGGGPLTPAQAAAQGIADGSEELFVLHRSAQHAPENKPTAFVRHGRPVDAVTERSPATVERAPPE